MSERVFNFSAGPSVLPLEVLEQARDEMLCYGQSGQSVMEMSHRSADFKKIIEDAEANLRKLMGIPDDYAVLFLQGGGTLQFSMVPLNLMTGSHKADYVITGQWAKKAYEEAQKFGDVKAIASSEDKTYSYIPKFSKSDIRPDADYVYICYNNTIYGTHYNQIPDTGAVPLVADMSSCILSEEIDVSRFALIFAGAQKNIAPAGLTIVIVRKDLLGKADAKTPIYLDYQIHADKGSMYNTPPCYPIYIAGLVFKSIIGQGGLKPKHDEALAKARLIYDYLDASQLFHGTVEALDRSLMNITFVTGNEELDKEFISGAKAKGLINLAGHRTVGGMRASCYNAMPMDGVKALVDYMKEFEASHV